MRVTGGGDAEIGAAVGVGAAATRNSSSPSSPSILALSSPTAVRRPRPGTSWPGWTSRCSPSGATMIAYDSEPVTVPARRKPRPAAAGAGVAGVSAGDAGAATDGVASVVGMALGGSGRTGS